MVQLNSMENIFKSTVQLPDGNYIRSLKDGCYAILSKDEKKLEIFNEYKDACRTKIHRSNGFLKYKYDDCYEVKTIERISGFRGKNIYTTKKLLSTLGDEVNIAVSILKKTFSLWRGRLVNSESSVVQLHKDGRRGAWYNKKCLSNNGNVDTELDIHYIPSSKEYFYNKKKYDTIKNIIVENQVLNGEFRGEERICSGYDYNKNINSIIRTLKDITDNDYKYDIRENNLIEY